MREFDFDSDPLFTLPKQEVRRITTWIGCGMRFQIPAGTYAFLRIARFDLILETDMPVNRLMLYELVKFGWHATQSPHFQAEDFKILLKCLDYLSIEEQIFLSHQIHNIWKE